MTKWKKRRVVVCSMFLAIGLIFAPTTFAETSSSSNYQVVETDFGSASNARTCSDQYCNESSLGGGVNGNSSSANYATKFGPVTPNEPSLNVMVIPGDGNLGVLDSLHTSTSTMTVKVQSYMSDGYTMQIVGTAPKYGSHTLTTLATPMASAAGTEQFGINLVANTAPSFGVNPVQVPSGDFSYGVVNSNYSTANKFMFNSGDTVAHSDTSSGETDYTVSMIINISNSTPAGRYSGDFSAVVIPVY